MRAFVRHFIFFILHRLPLLPSPPLPGSSLLSEWTTTQDEEEREIQREGQEDKQHSRDDAR
jgi:hypothetical protein